MCRLQVVQQSKNNNKIIRSSPPNDRRHYMRVRTAAARNGKQIKTVLASSNNWYAAAVTTHVEDNVFRLRTTIIYCIIAEAIFPAPLEINYSNRSDNYLYVGNSKLQKKLSTKPYCKYDRTTNNLRVIRTLDLIWKNFLMKSRVSFVSSIRLYTNQSCHNLHPTVK